MNPIAPVPQGVVPADSPELLDASEVNDSPRPGSWQQTEQAPTLTMVCTARWTDYWKIWIVNVGLTLATLGIYSAWAKVRSKRYFYGHVQLAGSSFDYHGRPLAILRGRIVALVLFAGLLIGLQLGPVWGISALVAGFLLLPWLLVKAARFRAHNSSWRGLRFRFDGPVGRAYLVYCLPWLAVFAAYFLAVFLLYAMVGRGTRFPVALAVVVVLALLFALPFIFTAQKRYMIGHHCFGGGRFRFHAEALALVGIYFLVGILLIPLRFTSNWLGGFVEPWTMQVAYWWAGNVPSLLQHMQLFQIVVLLTLSPLILLFSAPVLFGLGYLRGRSMCWQWSDTTLVDPAPAAGAPLSHRQPADRLRLGFRCTLNPWEMAWHYFSNAVVIALSLGLLAPWAITRTLALRARSLEVVAFEPLEALLAQAGPDAGATGDEVGELLGLEIGL